MKALPLLLASLAVFIRCANALDIQTPDGTIVRNCTITSVTPTGVYVSDGEGRNWLAGFRGLPSDDQKRLHYDAEKGQSDYPAAAKAAYDWCSALARQNAGVEPPPQSARQPADADAERVPREPAEAAVNAERSAREQKGIRQQEQTPRQTSLTAPESVPSGEQQLLAEIDRISEQERAEGEELRRFDAILELAAQQQLAAQQERQAQAQREELAAALRLVQQSARGQRNPNSAPQTGEGRILDLGNGFRVFQRPDGSTTGVTELGGGLSAITNSDGTTSTYINIGGGLRVPTGD